eukprot:12868562-Alexandrium_andersonii.AAC.1
MRANPASEMGFAQSSLMRRWPMCARTGPLPRTVRPATSAWLPTASMSASEAASGDSAAAPRPPSGWRGVEAGLPPDAPATGSGF